MTSLSKVVYDFRERGVVFRFLFLAFILFSAQPALSATKADELTGVPESQVEGAPKPPPEPPKPFISRTADYLLSSQEGISDSVIILANEVDALFGNTRALDEYYDSSLVLSQKTYYNTIGKSSYDVGTNLTLNLPNWRRMEEGARRWWSGDNSQSEKVTKKEFKEANPWEFNSGVNIRFSRPVAYGVLGRVSKNFLTGPIVNHFTEQVLWDSDNLWNEMTQLTSDYAINRRTLFRFFNEADWAISNQEFNSYHGPSIVYTINKISLTSFDLRLITATENNNFYTDNYTAGITYRTSLHPLDWLFLQITPELSWPRSEHFTSVWTLYLTLEIVFGNKKQ